MVRTKLALLMMLGAAAACDGSDADPSVDAVNQQPLTCKSVALCTTYDIKTFTGTVPAPAGGQIRDGLYRLAYNLIPSTVGEMPRYSDDLDALMISGRSFNWAGFFRDELGTVSTSGTTATFQATQNCDRGSDGNPSTEKTDYPYTATETELHLFSHVRRSDGVEWDKMYVYVRVSDPAEVCRTVPSAPGSPGDSARCTVTNCACRFALEGTVNACT